MNRDQGKFSRAVLIRIEAHTGVVHDAVINRSHIDVEVHLGDTLTRTADEAVCDVSAPIHEKAFDVLQALARLRHR